MFNFLEVVADKVERLIALLKLSKNTVVYTGIEPMFDYPSLF